MAEPTPLPKHKYSIGIKILGGIVLLLSLYSLAVSPGYVFASKNLKDAEKAMEQQEYNRAALLFNEVLNKVPSSKRAIIGASLALFSNDDPSDDEAAFDLLTGVTIYSSDWENLSRVMPLEYQALFEDVTP